ncbi:MAG: gamma-glutamylcyclotransferase, partial [Proteobacteria bacterium]|nr:gamma-glutamylcyclotransferase [Pseudomonadota bacterium]
MNRDLPKFVKPLVIYSKLTDAERDAILAETRAGRPAGEPMWVFGFGSLMWSPCFEHDVAAPATLRGYDRKFHIW